MRDLGRISAQRRAGESVLLRSLVSFVVLSGLFALMPPTPPQQSMIDNGRPEVANRVSGVALDQPPGEAFRQQRDRTASIRPKAAPVEVRSARSAPRHLTDVQRATLQNRLNMPGANYMIVIENDMACPDCTQLSLDFSGVFENAGGWKVVSSWAGGLAHAPHGVAVLCADTVHLSPEARIVIDALNATGIEFDLQKTAYFFRPYQFGPAPTIEILLTASAGG